MPMRVQGISNFTILYRKATLYGIILPCLKLKNFNLPNHIYCINFNVTRVKFRITLKVRNVIHTVHVSQVHTLLIERLSTNSPKFFTAQLAHMKCH